MVHKRRKQSPNYSPKTKIWLYDYKVKKCGKFIYGGCGGNENNFATLEDCHKRCRPNIPGTCSMSMQIDMDNQIFVLGE
jgi:hypothetical protein